MVRPLPALSRGLAPLALLALAFLSACTSDSPDPRPDAGDIEDAGPPGDAGDGARADGGPELDAGPLDGGQADAGTELDGGAPDAGEALDASTEDAGSSSDSGTPDDAGTDGGSEPPLDASMPEDASAPEDASTPDGGIPGESQPTEPAEVVRVGTAGLLLRGTVLTPTGALERGEVLISSETITCVATNCSASPGAATATIIDTHGIISPGLIDAHNHLAYDFLDEWVPGRRFGDRYEWADDDGYEAWVSPYADARSTGAVFCPAAKWGEIRAITHGTTTMQGQSFQQSCINGLVRNAEHYDGFAGDQLATNIASVRDLNDSAATALIARFTATSNPVLRYAVHMAEGIDTPATLEFDSFAGRDPRANRHAGTSLLAGTGFVGTAVLIHSVPLNAEQLMEAADADAKLVWSPSSNIALYGSTADIATWLSLGLTIGLGPDWTPSGEDDMLAEMRFARGYGRQNSIDALTSRRIWEMATMDGAEVVGLAPSIGRLAVGARADLLVIGREGADPYDALIDGDVRDVRMVLVNGAVYFGEAGLEAAAINSSCDAFDACGAEKFVCVKGVPATGPSTTTSRTTETLADVEGLLVDRLATYGRTDLLPLAHECR